MAVLHKSKSNLNVPKKHVRVKRAERQCVDSGCTNRKLGSDMADSVTGGGINGKDCSKADVSVNIYAFLKAQETGKVVELSCAIGDEYIDGKPYSEIVSIAKDFIDSLGGFEKFSEWGLF
jgi:hypothetical protein